MKSKTKLFLLPMLALAIAATAFFGYANFNTPAKASAEWDSRTRTIYYWINTTENVYFHCWDNNGHSTTWRGENELTTKVADGDSDNWKCVKGTIYDDATGMIITRETENVTGDINVSGLSANTYYVYNGDFASYSYQLDAYYLVGSFNSWTISDEYKLGAPDDDGSWAQINNVTLNKNDELKIKYPLKDQMYGAKETNPFFSQESYSDSNALVNFTGTYTVYLSKGNGNQVWIDAGLDLKAVSHKTSSDKSHLLLVSAFNVGNLAHFSGTYAVTLGYTITKNSADASVDQGNTYYNAVNVKTSGDYSRLTSENIYAGCTEDTYKLIVAELDCTSGDNFNITVYIKLDGTVVASQSTSGTISSVTP